MPPSPSQLSGFRGGRLRAGSILMKVLHIWTTFGDVLAWEPLGEEPWWFWGGTRAWGRSLGGPGVEPEPGGGAWVVLGWSQSLGEESGWSWGRSLGGPGVQPEQGRSLGGPGGGVWVVLWLILEAFG